jgi:predicted membrane protein
MDNSPQYKSGSGRTLTGLAILAFGVLVLLHRMGYPIYPWIFTWPVFIIAIGVLMAIRRKFQSLTALFFIIIGLYLLARHQGWIEFSIGKFFWPAIIIATGLVLILRPRSVSLKFNTYAGNNNDADGSDVFDSVAIFWGARKTILSKKFAKGEIVNIFGGTEINFMQADINGTAVIDVAVVFGGVKLIVPPDWDVRINVVHIFAGTDDKRQLHTASISKKVLLINGTAVFGGIDIRSY